MNFCARTLLCAALVVSALAVNSATAVQVWPCTPGSDRQTWTITTGGSPHDNLHLGGTNGVPDSGLVLNTLGRNNNTGGVLNVWNYLPTNPLSQQWRYDASNGYIVSETNGLCAGTVNATGVLPAGSSVVQVTCAAVGSSQFWYNASTGLMVWGKDPSMCLDAGSNASCAQEPFSSYPYCNYSLPVQDRLNDLLARLTPVEVAAMLAASNNGVPRLGVPKLVYGEALHGVAVNQCAQPVNGNTGCPTSFPTGLALGATLNRTLWALVGDTIGKEGRALFNIGIAFSMFFTPDINPFRDPRWGRGMEVPGEDPYINGEYGASYIWSFQGYAGPDGAVYMRSVSMPKHFSAYDQEGNRGVHDRTCFCAPVPMQYLVGYHWPAFKAALQRGKPGGIMCSANGVNGYPSCVHSDYNNGILRGEWGWEGAMVTDGNGVTNLYAHYGTDKNMTLDCQPIARSFPDACAWGLHGGVDVELGETLNNYALEAVKNGLITVEDINTALARTMQYIFKLGLMDPPALVPWSSLGPADVDTPASRQLAYEAAVQAVILLRNNASSVSPSGAGTPVLPLSLPSLSGKTIAVIGPNADNRASLLANYHGINTLATLHTPLLAITAMAQAAGATVKYAPGCADIPCNSTTLFPQALAAAQGSSTILLFVGLEPSLGGNKSGTSEGEEDDRSEIGLPGLQEQLITAMLATNIPVVLVVMRGGGVALTDALYNDPRLTTVVDNIYPGEVGGDALAAVLFGKEAPSGRLTTTLYTVDFPSTRSIIDYDMSSGSGVTYQYYTGPVQWPFGYGLSYTTWQLDWLQGEQAAHVTVSAEEWMSGAAAPPAWGVNMTNTGLVTSSISVLGMLSSGVSGQPLQELFDFQRAAAVAPGQTVTMLFTLPPEVAAFVTSTGEVSLVPGRQSVSIVMPGAEGRVTQLQGSVQVLVQGDEGRVVLQRAPAGM